MLNAKQMPLKKKKVSKYERLKGIQHIGVVEYSFTLCEDIDGNWFKKKLNDY